MTVVNHGSQFSIQNRIAPSRSFFRRYPYKASFVFSSSNWSSCVVRRRCDILVGEKLQTLLSPSSSSSSESRQIILFRYIIGVEFFVEVGGLLEKVSIAWISASSSSSMVSFTTQSGIGWLCRLLIQSLIFYTINQIENPIHTGESFITCCQT